MAYIEQVEKILASLSEKDAFFENLHHRKMISRVPGTHTLAHRIVMEHLSSSSFEVEQLQFMVDAFQKYGDLNLTKEGNTLRDALCNKIQHLVNEVKEVSSDLFAPENSKEGKTKPLLEGIYKEADVNTADLTLFRLLRPDKIDEVLFDFDGIFVGREDLKRIKAIYKGYRNRVFSGKGVLEKYQRRYVEKYFQLLESKFEIELIGSVQKDSFVLKTNISLEELGKYTKELGYDTIRWTEFNRERIVLESAVYKKAGVFVHRFSDGSIRTHGMVPKYTPDFTTTYLKMSAGK